MSSTSLLVLIILSYIFIFHSQCSRDIVCLFCHWNKVSIKLRIDSLSWSRSISLQLNSVCLSSLSANLYIQHKPQLSHDDNDDDNVNETSLDERHRHTLFWTSIHFDEVHPVLQTRFVIALGPFELCGNLVYNALWGTVSTIDNEISITYNIILIWNS